jgi:hypothetical protein
MTLINNDMRAIVDSATHEQPRPATCIREYLAHTSFSSLRVAGNGRIRRGRNPVVELLEPVEWCGTETRRAVAH